MMIAFITENESDLVLLLKGLSSSKQNRPFLALSSKPCMPFLQAFLGQQESI